MNILVIFLICLALLIGIAILVYKSGLFDKPEPVKGIQTQSSNQQSQTMNQYAPQPVWGAPTDIGACNVYTFIGGQYIPAKPSYQTINNGDRGYYVNKWPNSIPQTCIDPDQLFVQAFTHECTDNANNSAGAGCILTIHTHDPNTNTIKKPGETVLPGVVEGTTEAPVYGQCTPTNLANNQENSLYCIGSIGLIIPNFTPQPQYESGDNMCLNGLYGQTGGNLAGSQGTIGYYNLDTVQCDLSEPGQIFRTIRYSLQDNGTVKQDDKGNIAAIIHRYTGYYLAPQLNINTFLDENNNVQYTYDFLNPIYEYNPWTDNTGATGTVSIPLALIPPSYDKTRNGVYWLLKNETLNAQYYDTNISSTSNYQQVGIMPNQSSFASNFPNAPSGVSYFTYLAWSQDTATGTTGPPPDLYASGEQGNCWFGTQTPGPSDNGARPVSNLLSGIAPQQIAYIPDLRLLPTLSPSSDPSRIWSYLINTYSINVRNDNTAFLTPYRKNSYVDVWFGCAQDTKLTTNFFTELLGAVKAFNPPYKNADTQFIDYSLYGSEIIKPVGNGYIPGVDKTLTFPGNINVADQLNPVEDALIGLVATRLIWLLFFA